MEKCGTSVHNKVIQVYFNPCLITHCHHSSKPLPLFCDGIYGPTLYSVSLKVAHFQFQLDSSISVVSTLKMSCFVVWHGLKIFSYLSTESFLCSIPISQHTSQNPKSINVCFLYSCQKKVSQQLFQLKVCFFTNFY